MTRKVFTIHRIQVFLKKAVHFAIFVVMIVFFISLLMLPGKAKAQRYLKGMEGVHISTGYVPQKGFSVNAGYSVYNRYKNRWIFSGDYLHYPYVYNAKTLPLQQICFSGEFHKKLFSSVNKNFYLSAGLGILAGYEMLNKGKKIFENGAVLQNTDGFVYGGSLGLEAEYYYDNQYVILFGVRQRVVGGSSVNLFRTQLYVGLKIMLTDKNFNN